MKKVSINIIILQETTDELDIEIDVKNTGDTPVKLTDLIVCLDHIKNLYVRNLLANNMDFHIELNHNDLKKLN